MKYRRNEELACKALRITYDFQIREGTLHLPKNHNCDCGRCVEFFKKIDPEVVKIKVFAGEQRDTEYSFNVGDSGNWSVRSFV